MKKVDFKDLKNLKNSAPENPLARDGKPVPAEPMGACPSAPTAAAGPRTRISVDVDDATLKKLHAITMKRQLDSGSIIPRASVVRALLLEAIDRHYQTESIK